MSRLKPHLADAKQLVLSPDSNLWLVPWAALPVEEGKYAIEAWQIRYVTSGRDLVAEQLVSQCTPSASRPSRRIFADPDYDLDSKQTQAATRAVLRGKETQLAVRAPSRPFGELDCSKAARLPGTATEARLITPALTVYAHEAPTRLQRAVCAGRSAQAGRLAQGAGAEHAWVLSARPGSRSRTSEPARWPATTGHRARRRLPTDGKRLGEPAAALRPAAGRLQPAANAAPTTAC